MEEKKLSYEALQEVCSQLHMKCLKYEEEIKSMKTVAVRLELLFAVIDRAEQFPEDWVRKCAEEVRNIIEIKKDDEDKKA